MQNPQSRNEAILQSMITGTEYTDPPQSRIEALLLKLKEVIEAGGGEIVVDDEISTTSTHPVQNRVIAANLLPAIAGITPNSSGSMELDREDLNDFTTSGIYNAMNCENAPFNDMALVILGYSMDGYCVQIACDVASGNFKFRNQIDGNWTAWGDNILSTLEAHTAAINELENNTKSIQSATGNPLTIQASESNLVECVAEVEAVQEGSGDPSPDNIRPITGQTEVVIEDVGKNLWGGEKLLNDFMATGIVSHDSTNRTISYLASQIVDKTIVSDIFKENTQYTIILNGKSSTSNTTNLKVIYEDGTSNNITSTFNTSTFTNSIYITAKNKTVKQIVGSWVAGNTTLKYDECGIFEGVLTVDDFEPYKGKTYTIQLGDTIYGGELDVITGELRVTHGEVDLGDLTWTYISSDNGWFYARMPSDAASQIGQTFGRKAFCSAYENFVGDFSIFSQKNSVILVSSSTVSSTNNSVAVRDSRYTDATSFKTAVTGQKLVYELAEPYTIQLTPQQIRLLKGTNNISCNTGDLSIKYYPDNVLGQLKGDIESEYDERVVNLEEKANNALKIKSITTTTGTNQQGVSSSSYDNYVQGDKKIIPLSITAKTPGYEVVDVHYVLDEINRLIYFIPKDLTGSAIPSGRTVSMTIYYFEI